jgi:hypothetical protein
MLRGGQAMFEMTKDGSALHAVRDGQLAVVTCAGCGCRLESGGLDVAEAWFHYGRGGGRDARGCRVACVDLAHDARGHVALAA